jgi:hypothetical protein
MKRVHHESELTIEMLEHDLELAAILVDVFGPRAMCMFEVIERKLEEVRARGNTMARVRKVLGATGASPPSR